MSARMTIERILRDDGDASGQTVRQWRIEIEASHVKIRLNEDVGAFLMLRVDDIAEFRRDLNRAEHLAKEELAERAALTPPGGEEAK